MKNYKINKIENLFTEEDINFFLKNIENAEWEKITIEKDYFSLYTRCTITDFSNYRTKVEKFLNEKYGENYELIKNPWVNKVVPSTNTNDAFHFDKSDLTIITYLNDDFTGGEFQYVDKTDNNIEIIPKMGMSLIMNKHLFHRVLPVKSGERLSLICFFHLKTKISKSII